MTSTSVTPTALRTQEFGVRLALGATSAEIRRLALAGTLRLAIGGIVLGMATAFALGRFLTAHLFEVSATDPFSYLVVSAVLLGVAVVAGLVPAWRASRVDSMVVLRYE